jgi:molybdate transport system ATP-binding protein
MIDVDLQKKLSGTSGDLHLSVRMQINGGELVALYGESGAGKTSILRMIAGLLPPDSGTVVSARQVWFDHAKKIHIPTQQRNIGFVFQDHNLFPNMSVRENIAFALPGSGRDEGTINELVAIMELQGLEHKKPHQLSGGQRQRASLARAIARRPALLLLDEPLSALDTALRFRMQDFILKVHKSFGLTTILVSHDLLEVARLAERVFVLENGQITKTGSPSDVVPAQHIRNMVDVIDKKLRSPLQ